MVLKIEAERPRPFGREILDRADRFYESSLRPSFEKVLENDDVLYLDLSDIRGTYVNTSAFLRRMMGRWVDDFGICVVNEHLGFVEDTPELLKRKVKTMMV